MAANDRRVSGVVLPCGHPFSELWDHVRAGTLDEHERSCRYCAATADTIGTLDEATRLLREQAVDVPRRLTAQIMRRVRAELHRDTVLVRTTPLGPIRLGEHAARALFRTAVDGVPGVVSRGTDLVDRDVSGTAATRVRVALDYAVDGIEAVDAISDAVRAVAASQLNVDVVDVEVVVEDVLLPTEPFDA